MKKLMILLLFVQFLTIKSDMDFDDEEAFFKAKCEDDKSKTGACAYEIRDSKNDKEEYALFDKCGKGKTCDPYYRLCVKNLEKKKNGKSCNYDNDCLSGACISNKCGGLNEGERYEYVNCKTGLVCASDSSNALKCVKPAKDGEKSDYTKCMDGLKVDKDGKCAKYGSLENGSSLGPFDYTRYFGNNYNYNGNFDISYLNEVDDERNLLCKSGLSHLKVEGTNFYYVCDTIETEPVCKDGSVTTAGKWTDGTAIPIGTGCRTEEDYTGAEKDYYAYSKLQSKLYGDFLNDYNGLDLEKINSEEDSIVLSGKLYEKYFLYKHAPALKAAGIIDSDGNVVDSKKCEYEFIIKQLNSSSFIKLKTIIIAIFALLF
jgi:hypothetical protein